MVEYINRGLRLAEQRDAQALVIRLNTPGGDLDSMGRITSNIRASKVPVVVYVAPAGSMAASAGTLITLSAHVAAMAPQTIIGAASPVGGQGEDLETTESLKVKEAMKASVRAYTEQRGAEATRLAEETIDNARAVSSTEAKAAGLIDLIANSDEDLLRQLDGRAVITADGQRTIVTAGAVTDEVPNSFIEQLLAALTNPNIVFLLLTIGVQALLIELSSPGGWVAGFIGVVCLALAVYGLGILPINWFGLVLLVISFVLFILDIKAPTHGALTVAGIGTFVVGALVLFNSPGVPAFQRVSVPLVIGTALVTAAIFATILSFALRAQKVPVKTGKQGVIGQVGIARSDLNPYGTVMVDSELWSAELAAGAPAPLAKGSEVEVIAISGVRVQVRPVAQNQPNPTGS
jgi:membrane-bound serine protease (ClpP class)